MKVKRYGRGVQARRIPQVSKIQTFVYTFMLTVFMVASSFQNVTVHWK